MTKIAEVLLDRYSAVACWSPLPSHPDLVALASKDSGGIDFESTGGELRLYRFDYHHGAAAASSADAAAHLLVCIPTAGRFSSLDWSAAIPVGASRTDYPLGLIAGGMEDGSTVVWDAAKLLKESGSSAHDRTSSHEGARVGTVTSPELRGHRITALTFHPTEPWTLAIGSNTGSVVVADLSSPSREFSLLDLATSANRSQHNGEVTALAWNSQVGHILASSSIDGSVGVWDVKAHKSWCMLQVEQGGVGCVAWNPKEGLYLVTASIDDRNPVMKVYDLGSSTSLPLATLVGHSAGILGCSWCPHDETLLLSSSRDNRVMLWDLCALHPVAELPPPDDDGQMHAQQHHSTDPSQLFATSQALQAQKHLRVSAVWSPCKRGLCLTTSLDKKVQVHSILALATRAGRPPKWIRPGGCCATTGFGGGVVRTHTYSGDPPQPGQNPRLYHYVSVQTIPEQPSWVEQALQLEEELATTPVAEFCQRRRRLDPTNRMWGFLSVVVQTDSRERLLAHLGFDATSIAQAAQAFQPELSPPARAAAEGAENGLDKLSLDDSSNGGQRRTLAASTTMSAAAQELVKKSLIVGNFEAAVDCCFKSGNLADALLISYCGGAELWAHTQQRYLSNQQVERPYLSLLTGIVQSQWDTLVAESSTIKWQETVAILCSYAQSDEFPRLCIALGDRLEESGAKESASLCYICALSVSHASRYWISQLQSANAKSGGALDWKALHELVTKATVFLNAVASPQELPPDLAELYSQFSQTLAEQGLLALAARYCRGSSTESKVLRDRLYRSRSSQRCWAEMGSPPEFPFSVEAAAASLSQQMLSTSTSSRSSRAKAHAASRGPQQSRQTHSSHQPHAAQSSYASTTQPATSSVTAPTPTGDALPPGWFALQDPASGMTYYANQTTGETSWERPIASQGIVENMPNFTASDSNPMKDSGSVKSTSSSVNSASKLSTKATLVSKYGDGFVTSASHPELADQYGNVGTSNPYTGVSRPGTAAAVLGSTRATEQAPASGPVDLNTLELEAHHAQIKDTLLALYDHLQSVSYPSEKRQLEEAKRGIDLLIKILSRNSLEEDTESKVMSMVGAIANHDIRTAASIQTALVSTDWKAHKDWLKGIKVLLQLATKKM